MLSPSSRLHLSCHPKAQCCATSGREALPRPGHPPGFLTPILVPVLAGALPWTSASLARTLTASLALSHHPVPLSSWPASCFNLNSPPPWPSATPLPDHQLDKCFHDPVLFCLCCAPLPPLDGTPWTSVTSQVKSRFTTHTDQLTHFI